MANEFTRTVDNYHKQQEYFELTVCRIVDGFGN